ncbi:hypothetical protein SAMN02746009_02429 [Hymenobacter psychrotolerans DSM 18569]|uniref:Uncharacterized protein n=2 Tax=Hymenobacter psychrotolerans TaxID=344998 RepID=A0A1M6Z5N0_9BACT|nr:hypothetical protein SAMN02746009_02429 [Hymenobacter psychrotolerans DSM 18569]
MVWQNDKNSDSVSLKSWDALANLIGVRNFEPQNLEKESFRKQHHITLGFMKAGITTPFYELDVVSLKDGADAYLKYKGENRFVAIDNTEQEHSLEEISSVTKMANYYVNKERFHEFFPNAGL